MQGVACFVGFDAGEKRQACLREVTNQIQGFVPAKLVGETQRAVHDAVVGENDGVLERAAANEAHGFERFDVALETESSRPSQKVAECIRPNQHFHFLLAHQRVRKIYVAAHTKLIGRINTDSAITFDDLQRLQNLQIPALPAKFANARMLQHLHERLRRTVENGHFDGVNVDVNVVDATGIDGGKQMLGGGEQNALLHEAGGITDASDVVPLRFNREIVQVNAPKHDACFSRGGYQADVTVHARVEAHTFRKRLSSDVSLEHVPNLILACCLPTSH